MNDLEQYFHTVCSVRREHLREIQERLNLARKHRLAPSAGSAAKEVASALEIAGIEPEVEFPKVVLPPLKQRRVEMDPKDEADDELELLDWRSKKLPST